ncbi:putative methyltransferase-like protein 25 isoform X2 [Oratosquilla oratoria]|uniref:putative methyltransferase-like protein 25 isoform X2 n=1 Tax=Oratosquilla oratoria TaxID=337810 RepID=UPI003F770236
MYTICRPTIDVDAVTGFNWESCSLSRFLTELRKHQLSSLGVLTDIQEILDNHKGTDVSALQMKNVMSEKKSHEVEVMSSAIAQLTQGSGIEWVLDLGSGKGYLSTSLVVQHGINVLAIDSSNTNTKVALVRKERLQKYWKSVVRNEKEFLATGVVKKGKNWRKKKHSKKKQVETNTEHQVDESREENPVLGDMINAPQALLLGVTRFVTEETNLMALLVEGLHSYNEENCREGSTIVNGIEKVSIDNVDLQNCDCETQTLEYDYDKNMFDVCTQKKEGKSDEVAAIDKTSLVGLHTCGNLAASSLRIFCSNLHVKFLCNVGCCYHLMDEEFCENPFIVKKSSDNSKVFEDKVESSPLMNRKMNEDQDFPRHNSSPGPSTDIRYTSSELDPLHPSRNSTPQAKAFPMSSYLLEQQFALGRNARMLAAQPADRLAHNKDIGGTALFWRALLQVLMQEKGMDTSAHVGRIAAKCSNFHEYTTAAFKKLEMGLEYSSEDIQALHSKYMEKEDHMCRFFYLRSSLAPIIEGLILLDRLVFLCEQTSVEAAYLVRLFNPVTSPRCHAVFAFRG